MSPSWMIFLVHPDSTFLQRANILSKDSELYDAGPNPSRVGGDDDVSLALLGRSQGYDLPICLPL